MQTKKGGKIKRSGKQEGEKTLCYSKYRGIYSKLYVIDRKPMTKIQNQKYWESH